jgi:hypothetical protein
MFPLNHRCAQHGKITYTFYNSTRRVTGTRVFASVHSILIACLAKGCTKILHHMQRNVYARCPGKSACRRESRGRHNRRRLHSDLTKVLPHECWTQRTRPRRRQRGEHGHWESGRFRVRPPWHDTGSVQGAVETISAVLSPWIGADPDTEPTRAHRRCVPAVAEATCVYRALDRKVTCG